MKWVLKYLKCCYPWNLYKKLWNIAESKFGCNTMNCYFLIRSNQKFKRASNWLYSAQKWRMNCPDYYTVDRWNERKSELSNVPVSDCPLLSASLCLFPPPLSLFLLYSLISQTQACILSQTLIYFSSFIVSEMHIEYAAQHSRKVRNILIVRKYHGIKNIY